MEASAAAGGVSVRNGQEKRVISPELLTRLATCGAETLRIVGERYLDRVKLPGSVAIVLLDDAEIGRVHGEFLGDPKPTDVITFPYGDHGEILISVETAERQAAEFKATVERELALYVIHGILHLGGYEDGTDLERRTMEELQQELLEELFVED